MVGKNNSKKSAAFGQLGRTKCLSTDSLSGFKASGSGRSVDGLAHVLQFVNCGILGEKIK